MAQGVPTCFGVPGESYLAVLDGFHEYRDRIRFVACRQEGGAAFMAEAQGKLSGRPGICFVTRGPGATNASIGVHTAFQDSTPMILFVGQVASDQRDREAFQELDYRQMFGPGTLGLAKWVGEVQQRRPPARIRRPRLPHRDAGPPRPGGAGAARGHAHAARPAAPVLPRVEPVRAWPAPGGLRDLRAMLLAAERPIVIAGGSGWDAEAASALQRFAENWQLPVACGWRFQDTFDNRHPLYAGDVGIGINPKLAARIRARRPRHRAGRAPGRDDHRRLHPAAGAAAGAEAGPRPRRRRGTGPCLRRRPAAAGLDGLAAKALETLAAPADVPWAAHTAAARADYEANLVAPAVEPLDLAVVVKTLQRLLPEDTVFTNGAGNYSGWLHRYCRHPGLQHHGRTQLAPTSGAMGYGLPAAVAAALLHPQRTVVNLAGDGDFLMTGQELATATRLRREEADQHRRRQRQLRHHPHAPGARIPRAASAAATSTTPTSPPSRAPTAGAASSSTARQTSNRRCSASSKPARRRCCT